MAGYDDFSTPVTNQPAQQASPYDEFSTPVIAPRSSIYEAATQPVYGFNEGLDALYNLPNAGVNVGAHLYNLAANAVRREAGYPEKEFEPPIQYARIASRFNEPDPFSNIANDAARSLGYEKPFPGAAPETGGEQPTTTTGRYARAIGQQAGASVAPTAGMMARGMIPATRAAVAQTAASATGSGVAGEATKEAGYGPTTQAIAQIAGGFAAPTGYNIGKKLTTDIPGAAINFGKRVTEEARNPALAADRDTLDMMRRSGVDLNEMKGQLYPKFPRGSDLPLRGFTDEHLADIIFRRLDGEDAADIAQDYAHLKNSQGKSITPETIDNYAERYRQTNLTPMNLMGLTQEQVGFGGAQPMLRGARKNMIIANTGEAAKQLYDVQMAQPARMAQAVEEAIPGTSSVNDLDFSARAAQEQAINAIQKLYPGKYYQVIRPALEERATQEFNRQYQDLWAQKDVPLDEGLARILADPLGQSAYNLAMRAAAREGNPIPSHEELLRSFGLLRNPGLNLNREGIPQEPPQYPEAPPVEMPVRALDYFQRALRRSAKAGLVSGNPEAVDFNTLRQQLLEHLDPANAVPGTPSLVPGFRALRSDYHAGMADQGAMDLASGMSLGSNEKTINALQEFHDMPPSAQELFRLRFARNLQDLIGNRAYGSDPLAAVNSRNAENIIRDVFGDEGAAKIMTGLESARRTGAAMKWGENLALNLGSANTRMVLSELKNMSPAQQDLVRQGLKTKVLGMLGQGKPGADVASQFSTPNAATVLKAVIPNEADDLIRTINREVISTGGKNFVFGNSNTAQTLTDVDAAMQSVRAGRDLAMGRVGSFFDQMGNWLARQIGEQRASIVVKNLSETNPPEMLRTLDRLIEMAPNTQERDALRLLKEWGPFGPGRGWMAGEPATVMANAPTDQPHARKAPDNEWYIPDPARPGKLLRVRPVPGSSKGALQVMGSTP
jgi:hypothetical protein